jgi:general nucleoside transport system permease protein
MDVLYFIVQLAIASAIPLTLVAFGALFAERSGVINIAMEGIMLMGGFLGAVIIVYLEGIGLAPQGIVLLALLTGAIVGTLYSMLHAFASVSMKSDQIISATALNLFAPAFAIFMARTYGAEGTRQITLGQNYKIANVPILSEIPLLGPLFFQQAFLSTYIGILIFVVSYLVLYKTRFGLRLRACGENPSAADSVGINIYHMRYAGVMISGALAGMGGVIFVLSFANTFSASVNGFGFLAIAVLIFGQWKPRRIILAASFFGLMRVIASAYDAIPILSGLGIPREIYSIIPYVATLVVLAFVSKTSAAPRAAGQPYDAGKR